MLDFLRTVVHEGTLRARARLKARLTTRPRPSDRDADMGALVRRLAIHEPGDHSLNDPIVSVVDSGTAGDLVRALNDMSDEHLAGLADYIRREELWCDPEGVQSARRRYDETYEDYLAAFHSVRRVSITMPFEAIDALVAADAAYRKATLVWYATRDADPKTRVVAISPISDRMSEE